LFLFFYLLLSLRVSGSFRQAKEGKCTISSDKSRRFARCYYWSVGPNQAQLNACVAALLRGFFTEDQLANFSLSGQKGPTANPDGPVKDKLPVNIRAGIKCMFTFSYILFNYLLLFLSNRLCDQSVDEIA